ncbi:crotonase/enoyl-CoA hydratase family protein [Pseudaestuariivita atlantica]|uniref:Enoyl-CoA hydratase n=1 Tax=Pseudaestuariivita atlantica TaxID=1317121 RepID=A0A0L1JLZ4_9RHOB|nr:crotonase/enoyl-CoA hydratase family protein [Pseudaestuariivita atlantica]KNG92742.1 enoyl-CoA hydratase [Pseudaestuariivita atlantica]
MARVSVEIDNHVAQVRLTRGDKMNAFDRAMIEELIGAAHGLDRDDVRVVVLSGEGRAFSAGLDVASFAAFATQDPATLLNPRTHGDTNDFQEVSLAWHKLPVPVIAALHGTCFGAGLQVALGADIRIAAPDTKMSVMEMKWGLVPDMGSMIRLPHLAPSDIVRRLVYTGEVFAAEAALGWGIVTELADDPQARADALAAEIAGKSPSAIRAAKRLMAVAETQAPDAVLLAESAEQAALIGKPHQMEAVMANMQKRAPKF